MKLHVFLFFFHFLTWVFGQQKIVHFSTTNGLPHNITYGLLQDSKGYLWIGTDNGLVKYNGRDFKIFNADNGLRNSYIIDVKEDTQNDQIVLASWGGGIHFIKDDKVVPIKTRGDSLAKINNVLVHQGRIIAKHFRRNLIYKRLNGTYTVATVVPDVSAGKLTENSSLLRRSNGCFGKLAEQLYYFNGNQLLNRPKFRLKGIYRVDDLTTLKPVFLFLKDSVINTISQFDESNFIASIKKQIVFFNKNQILNTITLDIPEAEIVSVKKSSNNTLLILATNEKGFKNAYRYNIVSKNVLSLKEVLPTKSTFSDVLEDHEGNIWISTDGDGLYCLINEKKQIRYITGEQLPERNIMDIKHVSDKTFVLTPNYCSEFDGITLKKTTKLNGFGKSLSVFGTTIMVNSVNQKKGGAHDDIIERKAFFSKELDSIGEIFHVDSISIPKLKKRIPVPQGIIADGVFFANRLWIATNTGLHYLDPKSDQFRKGDLKQVTLPSKQVKQFLKTGDSLWIGTAKGLVHLKKDTTLYYSTTNGLINEEVNHMAYDSRGSLWVATKAGISILTNDYFVNVNEDLGLLSSYVSVMAESSEKKMWVGGSQGLTIIDNAHKWPLNSPPLFTISQNGPSFGYDVISYNRSQSLSFQYKIDETHWKETTSAKGILQFDKLSRGNHTVFFRAKKYDSEWSATKQFSFKVNPPWYKDWRILFILFTFLLATVTLMANHRIQKAKKRNAKLSSTIANKEKLENELRNVRENIARDFHDDLGNRLARISIFSELLYNGSSKINDEEKELIHQISSDSDSLYKGTKDFIFSLKSDSDFLEEVITYLSDFGEDYFRQFDIDFEVYKDVTQDVKLPYYWSKHLIFIFKEAMTNVVKHAECSKVTLTFKYQADKLIIECKDDGIGFDVKSKKMQGGLLNMSKRAEKINGTFVLRSKSQKGSSVRFMGKLH